MTHRLTSWRYGTLTALFMALALMVSLSACSSGGEGESASPSASDSTDRATTEGIANPTLPERPAEMDNYDEDGAIAAAEYFLRLSLYGFATGEWDEYNALSSPDCAFCQSYQKDRTANRDSSVKQYMPEMKIHDSFAWTHEENPEQIRVNLIAEQYPCTAQHSDGTTTKSEGQTTALAFLLEFTDDWHIIAVLPFDVDEYYKDVQVMNNE